MMRYPPANSEYNPRLPASLAFPRPPTFCLPPPQKLAVFGSIPAGAKLPPQLVLRINETEEVLGLRLDLAKDYVARWSSSGGKVVVEQGQEREGTTLDHDEPFKLQVTCDDDGWVVSVNDETYPHFYHDPELPWQQISTLDISGHFEVNFAGFVAEGNNPRQETP